MENINIFDGLDTIDWSHLHHAYGNARDTPDAIRALISDDPQIRKDALYQLDASILHQGTIYEALSYAIPFLLRIVQLPHAPNRQAVFAFLARIWDEYDYLLSDTEKEPDPINNRQEQSDQESDTEAHNISFRVVLISTRATLLIGYPIYVTLLEDSDPDIQQTAASLLAQFHEKLPETAAIFQQALYGTTKSKQKSVLITSLATLWVRNNGSTSQVNKLLTETDQKFLTDFIQNSNESPDVRFAAAIEAVRLFGDATIAEAIPVMFQGLAFISGKATSVDSEAHGLLNQLSSALIRIGSQAIPGKRMQIMGQLAVSNPDSRWETIYAAYSYIRSNLNRHQPRAALAWYMASSTAEDSRLRIEAAGEMKALAVLWRWIPPQVAPRLIEMLDDVNALVRFQATESLIQLGITVEMVLTNAVITENIKNKCAIQEILKRIHAQKPTFAERSHDPLPLSWSVVRLVEALKVRLSNNNMRAKPPVIQLIFTLGHYGTAAQAAIPLLRIALQNSDDWVRAEAARALHLISHDSNDLKHASSALRVLAIVGANHNTAKLNAARFLAQFNPEEVVLIVEMLYGWLIIDRFLRVEICELLWQLDQTHTEFIVERLLSTSRNSLSAASLLNWYDLNLLGKIGPAASAALPTLQQIIESEQRIYQGGSAEETIAGDEALLQMARQAFAHIKAPKT